LRSSSTTARTREKYGWYKNRDKVPPEVRAAVDEQVTRLREDVLPALGYKNLFCETGYEADDLIAWASGRMARPRDVALVSGDEDLWQLLRKDVHAFRPVSDTVFTKEDFLDRFFGLAPPFWPEVKALAGCTSDTIPGIGGVGQITAAKFLVGESVSDAKRRDIMSFMKTDQYKINLELVTLPYPGCPRVSPTPHAAPDADAWNDVVGSMGMTTLMAARRGIKK
jgi:5'-3' exonuclease